ncbi:MAG TPA: FAD-dependent oxidoreductase, partial [Tepidisphaeraceae bacterium]
AALWSKAAYQPNLTLLLNCACCGGETEAVTGDPDQRRLSHIRCWQLTSQTWHTISAKIFIDCSGDSVLAPITGAETRWGREARSEFNEDIQPSVGDDKTMGNTCLIQLRKTDHEISFTPPPFAYRFDGPEDMPHRIRGVQGTNFWWLELGGLQDTIHDAETIRDDLLRTAWGVWDYIKNRSPDKAEAATWALEFLGSLPGKRENRRYVGEVTMSQNDVIAAGDPHYYSDAIAYGGWSMDDHHPAGMLYPGQPTVYHHAPSPYVIPYRVLFSRNINNLMMAGRNISVTHAALSSTRVMATCAMLGQAAGTGAALAVRKRLTPAQIYPHHIAELQQTLMQDDAWLPGRTRAIDPLTLSGQTEAPVLLAGHDRPIGESDNATMITPGKPLTLQWQQPVSIQGARLLFDSNLSNDKRMPCRYPHPHTHTAIPHTLVKSFRLEARRDGQWTTVFKADNHQRLVTVPLNVRADALRFTADEIWGRDEAVRLFGFEATQANPEKPKAAPERIAFKTLVAAANPIDLAPPESDREQPNRAHSA